MTQDDWGPLYSLSDVWNSNFRLLIKKISSSRKYTGLHSEVEQKV